MVTRKERITSRAVDLISSLPDGIRYSELVRKMQEQFPQIPDGTIRGAVWDLDVQMPRKIYKPARGLFRHTSFKQQEIPPGGKAGRIREEDFYQPFADWLVNELEECTKAIPLGGNRFKDKWGTPDVIGKRESRRSDIIRAATEIVSAEVKADTKDLITAFGQACSYKLFSHKSYIVVPKGSSQEDIARMDALCLIFGIGLILFDSTSVQNPQFEIRVRPREYDPDMFYLNRYMKLVEKELFT